jgi:hypothetical protein
MMTMLWAFRAWSLFVISMNTMVRFGRFKFGDMDQEKALLNDICIHAQLHHGWQVFTAFEKEYSIKDCYDAQYSLLSG